MNTLSEIMVLGSSNHATLVMGISLAETLEVMLIDLLQKVLVLWYRDLLSWELPLLGQCESCFLTHEPSPGESEQPDPRCLRELL